ncbi:sensor histidine kinase [Corallococcus terminator]|uniref:histidine kinase n=1 Tax=Corallococcus terminator TaxID=2316733 RepID=A0A3A8J5S5_9BACT|nr:HAMP domain-containing sensor histidine kinase [Corallococcus terminator]RKG90835.1 sensor histidine kinase [Corallococcus terminator]
MSARRSPPPPHPVPAPEEKPGLLRKYRELLAKHEQLVRRLEERTTLHVSTFRLSSWALETSDSALAVLSAGSVVLANSRWHALNRNRGPWQRMAEPGLGVRTGAAPTHASLREMAQVERDAALALESVGSRVARYRQTHEAHPQVLEVRSERVAGPLEGHVLVLARDITEQARDEEELLCARATMLERAQIRALGELSAGMAHDLRNTLNAMRMRLEMLQHDVAPTGQHQPHLEALARIVSDADARVSRLQDFTRQKARAFRERVQLTEVVRDAVDIARGGIEHRPLPRGHFLRLNVVMPPRLPLVAGSAMELRYVLINLLINARDAMSRGGTIHVRAVHKGATVRLTVEDEGTGIAPEHLPHLFQSFFTTKGNDGTGLGLSMAHGVVTRAGGTLTGANRKQGGAVFTLTFPALAADRKSPKKALAKKATARRKPR